MMRASCEEILQQGFHAALSGRRVPGQAPECMFTMSTAGHDSSAEFGPETVPMDASAGDVSSGGATIWLDGDVLACACPECGAPMSIRLWLMVADCWRCNTSIELSEEQEEEALRLLRRQEETRRNESRQAAAAISATLSRGPKPALPPPSPPQTATETIPPAATKRRRVAASETRRGARAHVRKLYEKGGVAVFLGRLLNDLPAWLVSLVVHAVALLLMGLWVPSTPEKPELITLSTSVSYEDAEGDFAIDDPLPTESFEFEDAGEIEFDSSLPEIGAGDQLPVLHTATMEIPIERPLSLKSVSEEAFAPNLVELPAAVGKMFAGRNPRARAQILHAAGGTSETEAAVARGLKFLSRYQNTDGSWSLHSFRDAKQGDPKIGGEGRTRSDMAATAMALLPFLGAGQTHLEGEYKDTVYSGLKWLVEHQGEDGDLRGAGNGRMYAHAQATIALCEAYQLSGDEQLREPAQLALNFIVGAQHGRGGWRYEPGEAGDTSVVGWQLMALKSGQAARLRVPTKTFEAAERFIDSVQSDKIGGRYAYRPGGGPTNIMTAEALLCRQYLGWPKTKAGLRNGIDYLLKDHPPDAEEPDIYYWYYATQVMHHFGGTRWRRWNAKMRRVLVDTQETEGGAAGSWKPVGGFSKQGGRIYMTCLAICTLEVYYRHMPLYSKKMLQRLQDFE